MHKNGLVLKNGLKEKKKVNMFQNETYLDRVLI